MHSMKQSEKEYKLNLGSSVIPATVFTLGTQNASISSFASKIKGRASIKYSFGISSASI